MFRELLAAWRNRDPLKDMFRDLVSMIEAGKWMFETVWPAVAAGKVTPEVKEAIFKRDVEVNETERRIRKHIVEHMVAQPGVDVPACLVLMSVVKDAERIGDYCKDLIDAAALQERPLSSCDFYSGFREIQELVEGLFGRTRQALVETDQMLAQEVIVQERDIAQRCENLIERVATQDFTAHVAVPWALIARFLWRIASHVSNVASGIVMPVHKLDYYDEKYLSQPKGRVAPPPPPRTRGPS